MLLEIIKITNTFKEKQIFIWLKMLIRAHGAFLTLKDAKKFDSSIFTTQAQTTLFWVMPSLLFGCN